MSFEPLLSLTGISLVGAIFVGIFGSVRNIIQKYQLRIYLTRQYIISTIGTAIYNLYFHPLAKYPGISPSTDRGIYLTASRSGIQSRIFFPRCPV